MLKKWITLAFVCLVASCNQAQKTKNNSDRYFLVSHAGAGDPFWNIEFKGAKKAAATLGIDLQIVAPETPNDVPRQIELLDAAIASKPKGIAISIPDNNAFSKSLLEAQKQGIPVVAFNTRPNGNALGKNPYLAFVGMDDYQAGRKLAEQALKTGRLKDLAVVAIHQAGQVALEQRFAGIRDVLAANSIKVDKLDISSDATQSWQIAKGYLTKNKNTSAVFLLGPTGLHAVGRSLGQEFPTLLVSTFDLTPLTVELIKNKTVALTVDQQPFMQGFMAVTQLTLAADYNLMPANIDIQAAIVDQSNAETLQELVKQGVR